MTPDLLALSLVVTGPASPAPIAPPSPLDMIREYAARCPLPVGWLDAVVASGEAGRAAGTCLRWYYLSREPEVGPVDPDVASGDWGPAGRQ